MIYYTDCIWGGGYFIWASLIGLLVKNLPAVQETQVPSLGWEDPLEKEMATRSTILACRIPWIEEPGSLQSMELQKNQTQLSDENDNNEPRKEIWAQNTDLRVKN